MKAALSRTAERLFVLMRRPIASTRPTALGAEYRASGCGQWYDPVMLTPSSIGRLATDNSTLREVRTLLGRLKPDDYGRFVHGYYQQGLTQYGGAWVYADILSALFAAASLLRPENYLEIGVRRARSMAAVALACPTVRIVGFDLWVDEYAGMSNPGPEFVRDEMGRMGLTGTLELVSGDSHETVPAYFQENPDVFFDLITVDGDHSEAGATADLLTVIPRLKRGGVLVFDDISHPHHPELSEVWEKVIVRNRGFLTWEFRELGFGVGIAMWKP